MTHAVQELMAQDAKNLIAHYEDKQELKEHWRDRHILLTGSSGLIGLNFLMFFNQLAHDGVNLRVTAAINQAHVPLLDLFEFHESIVFKRGDLTAGVDFLHDSYDSIIHAASYGQPGKFMSNAISTLKLNSETLLHLVDFLREGGDLLFTSTSEVYHSCPHSPHREDHIGVTNTDHPRSCYIEAKRFGETLVNILRNGGFNAVSSRLSMAYGPGTRPDDARVINQFIYRALHENHLRLLDSGAAKRGYLYVTDAIDIMLRMVVLGKNSIYNCGGTSAISIRELADRIGTIVDVSVTAPESGCGSEGAPAEVLLDQSLVYQHLVKRDFVDFNDGLVRTIAWQREMYQALSNS